MNYASLIFLIFCIGVMLVYYIIPKKYRWLTLTVSSLAFFYIFSGWLVLYAIIGTAIAYAATRMFEKIKHKKTLYLISILLVLGFLIVLKYNNFFSSIINPIIGFSGLEIPFKKFILPVGISYYTLEMIAYITDIYRKKYEAEKNYLKLLTFFTFFPKIVEGPFSRYNKLSPTLFGKNEFNYDNFRKAFVLIGYGFLKKLVIADRAGIFVNTFFDKSYSGTITILVMILYTIQIYCDFSGSIDIITGVAELYGVKLDQNFRRPFFSKSIQEFWRRWHITLGEWLRDYIFYPISLSKINMKLNLKLRNFKFKHLSKFIIISFPLFFVWFLNGLWHGASIKYVVYGMYYYFIMMMGVLFKPLFDKLIQVLKINTGVFSYKFFLIIRTIIIVCFGMLMFRCDNLSQFCDLVVSIPKISAVKIFDLGLTMGDFIIISLGVITLFGVGLAREFGIDVRSKLEEQNLIFRWMVYLIIIFTILIFGIYGRGYEVSNFIYGGF